MGSTKTEVFRFNLCMHVVASVQLTSVKGCSRIVLHELKLVSNRGVDRLMAFVYNSAVHFRFSIS